MQEQWKDVLGYEGRYQVSDQGRVKSLARYVEGKSPAGRVCFRLRREIILKTQQVNSGYLVVCFSEGARGQRRNKFVHRLVARAFCEGDGPEVNHDDLIKTNNVATNLEWTTPKGNTAHAIANGRRGGKKKPLEVLA